MSKHVELAAEKRADFGKAASRRLRRKEDKVPAVVYGGGQEPAHIVLGGHRISRALESETFYSQIINLNIDGKKEQVILKALQRHPYKPKIVHMDFFRVRADTKLTLTIPVHFIGEEKAPGLKEGGAISHHINDLEISCLPGDIPEAIIIDVSNLGLDDVIHISQITPPKGVEIVEQVAATDDAHDHAVVSIHMPKLQAEPTPEELVPTEVPVVGEEEKSSEEESPSE